ncbi:hypothetical protein PoB_005291100 [Plakobranchus ocellatus]|uniref:Uncharacterized protein n=1 Tax=Plakobranchus ocellatus TaxID=259542 RepID=A0AAV4C0X5_9GAST|nr:hypothetical protein PoB_005291100 [Plakobranchus ocellatus]
MKPASPLKNGDRGVPSVTSRGGKSKKKWFSGSPSIQRAPVLETVTAKPRKMVLRISQSPESSRVLQTLTALKAQKKMVLRLSWSPESSRVL